MRYRMGADPGLTGAIAILDTEEHRVVELIDIPTMTKSVGRGRLVDVTMLRRALVPLMMQYQPAIYLEHCQAHGGGSAGATTSFKSGESYGMLMAVLISLAFDYQLTLTWVAPDKWKKRAGLTGKDKEASRTLARTRYPHIENQLRRKKDDNRAESILIAEFGY